MSKPQQKDGAYSFWKHFDLSLMLSDDPEAEAEILAAQDDRNKKLPVRMGISEFAALVEIIRMHKKKFRELEKHFSKSSLVESREKTGNSSVVREPREQLKQSAPVLIAPEEIQRVIESRKASVKVDSSGDKLNQIS